MERFGALWSTLELNGATEATGGHLCNFLMGWGGDGGVGLRCSAWTQVAQRVMDGLTTGTCHIEARTLGPVTESIWFDQSFRGITSARQRA